MVGPLVVIGGDAAGMSAAAEARRGDPGLEIVVLERGREVSYAACGIPYLVGGQVRDEAALIHRTPADFLRERRIVVRTGAEAVSIDAGARRVRLADGEEVGYGALVVATGARPVLPEIPGCDLPGVVALRDLPSARRALEAVAGRPRPRAVMVGSGAVGVEMAEAVLARGGRVVMAEREPRLLPALGAPAAGRVARALEEGGVEARPGAQVRRIARDADGLRVTIDRRQEPADLVVVGTGVAPNSGLALAAGCAAGPAGAIAVDRRGRTTVEGIWAAGDCATAHHRLLERPVWRPIATTANAMGRVVGRDVTGRAARFAGVLGSWVSRFGEVSFGATGLSAREAAGEGFAARELTREGRDRSGYMPGVRDLLVTLAWDERTGRLLGGEIAGAGEVSARLHTVSTALAAGMTVRELAECDFGYAPPVSPLRDPVQLAAAAAIGDAA